MARPMPRDEPAMKASLLASPRSMSGRHPAALHEGPILPRPGELVARRPAGHLQDEVAAVAELPQAGEDLVQVGVARAQRHRAAAAHPVLDVDATDSLPVSRELLLRPVAERSAVS